MNETDDSASNRYGCLVLTHANNCQWVSGSNFLFFFLIHIRLLSMFIGFNLLTHSFVLAYTNTSSSSPFLYLLKRFSSTLTLTLFVEQFSLTVALSIHIVSWIVYIDETTFTCRFRPIDGTSTQWVSDWFTIHISYFDDKQNVFLLQFGDWFKQQPEPLEILYWKEHS